MFLRTFAAVLVMLVASVSSAFADDPQVTSSAFITARPFISDDCGQLQGWCHDPEAHDITTDKGRDLQVVTKAPEAIYAPVAPEDVAAFTAAGLAWEPIYGFVQTDITEGGPSYAATLMREDPAIYKVIMETAIVSPHDGQRLLDTNAKLLPTNFTVKDTDIKEALAVCRFPSVGGISSVATKCAIYKFRVHGKTYVIARLGYRSKLGGLDNSNANGAHGAAKAKPDPAMLAKFDPLYAQVLDMQRDLGRATIDKIQTNDSQVAGYHPVRIAVDNITIDDIRYRLVAEFYAYPKGTGDSADIGFALDYAVEKHILVGKYDFGWELVNGTVPRIDAIFAQYFKDLKEAYQTGKAPEIQRKIDGCWNDMIQSEGGALIEMTKLLSHGYSVCFNPNHVLETAVFWGDEGMDGSGRWAVNGHKVTISTKQGYDSWPFGKLRVTCDFKATDRNLWLTNCLPSDDRKPTSYRFVPG